jgi:hypothetical protein
MDIKYLTEKLSIESVENFIVLGEDTGLMTQLLDARVK